MVAIWRYDETMRHPTLLNDILFKIVFGTKPNEPILRALLNAILGYSGVDRITQVDLLNPFNEKIYNDERGVVLDIKAQDGKGRFYNVEVQVESEFRYVDRSVYYAAELLASQLQKGQSFIKLAPTIGISLVDFELFDDQEDLHSIFVLYDVAHRHKLSDILEMHYIELKKFKESKPHALRTPFEKWLHILKYSDFYQSLSSELPPELQEEEGIDMALDAMNRALARDEVREMIEARLKFQRDEATRLEVALQQGIEKGIQQGIEKGVRQERTHVALKLLSTGFPVDAISQATGLSPEELKALESTAT